MVSKVGGFSSEQKGMGVIGNKICKGGIERRGQSVIGM